MENTKRTCPRCKREVAPELRDGVAVWKWHGTMVLGGKTRACRNSLQPIREARTRLGHQIQKALRSPSSVTLPSDPFEGFRDTSAAPSPGLPHARRGAIELERFAIVCPACGVTVAYADTPTLAEAIRAAAEHDGIDDADQPYVVDRG